MWKRKDKNLGLGKVLCLLLVSTWRRSCSENAWVVIKCLKDKQQFLPVVEGKYILMALSEINDFLVNVYCRNLGGAVRSCMKSEENVFRARKRVYLSFVSMYVETQSSS